MSNLKNQVPLGILLTNADLISYKQLQDALKIQSQYREMKLGEILILQAGLRAKTIDFFVNQWQENIIQGQQFPIGHYLKDAALLNQSQVQTILQEQKNNSQKFGVIAAKKGWIKQKTVNFLLNSLTQPTQSFVSLRSLEEYNNQILHLERKYANSSLILGRILAWTGGNGVLTRAICQVFADGDFNIPSGAEISAVDHLVEGELIRKWETSEVAEQLRYLRINLVDNNRYNSHILLEQYREIMLEGQQLYQDLPSQNELLNLGLVVKEGDYLRVANIIFQQVFDQEFIVRELKPQKPNTTTINPLNVSQNVAKVSEYSPALANDAIDPVAYDEPDQILEPTLIKEQQPSANSRAEQPVPNNTPEPLTKISSLITLVAIALLLPLVLAINNYYSSLLGARQNSSSTPDSLSQAGELQDFCNQLDTFDLSTSLSTIARLEREKQALLQDAADSSTAFPNSCEMALNRARVVSAPLLGKENRIFEAIKNLCQVPENSDMYLDAEVWLKRWYNSSYWGEETQFYLAEFSKRNGSDCPAANFTKAQN